MATCLDDASQNAAFSRDTTFDSRDAHATGTSATAVDESRMLVFGGEGVLPGQYLNDVYEFNLLEQQWTHSSTPQLQQCCDAAATQAFDADAAPPDADDEAAAGAEGDARRCARRGCTARLYIPAASQLSA